MNTNLWAAVLLLATCAASLSAQSQTFLVVKVGSTAVLPCDWRRIPDTQLISQRPHVEWRTFAETVFERRGAEMFQGEGYEKRADVPEDKLREGDCSLELRNITLADEGLYESFLLVRRTKRSLSSKRVLLQSVELSVDDTPEEIHRENPETERDFQRKITQNEYSSNNAGMIRISSQTFMIFLLPIILFRII